MRNRTTTLLITIAALFAITGCGSLFHVKLQRKYSPSIHGTTAKDIYLHFSLRNHRPWSYYNRGCTLLEFGHNDEAAEDFRTAISMRFADKARIHTYGVHFIDYFPHRELGIALFRMGNHAESTKELETSLGMADSERARVFLKLVQQYQPG